MKARVSLAAIAVVLLSSGMSVAQEIQVENLSMQLPSNKNEYSFSVLDNEIGGIKVTQLSVTGDAIKKETQDDDYRDIYLFVRGNGTVTVNKETFDVVPETVLVQNAIKNISIRPAKSDTLHFLKIVSRLKQQDKLDLETFPKENTQKVYFRRFTDCQAYTEPIKSPNTISRTIFPNKFIPRIAMGTVQANGPDKVDPHEHAMLEQLFFGLAGNDIVVFADNAKANLPAYSVLHTPLVLFQFNY